jgi:hypothetical protein
MNTASSKVTDMETFEVHLNEMTKSIRAGYSRKIAKMLAPDATTERRMHSVAIEKQASCACRVCYWAKSA